MAHAQGYSNIKNMVRSGRHSLLPPKIPFPCTSSSAYTDYNANPSMGSEVVPNFKDFYPHHQRTSSENLHTEEQPSWLDELLDEPDTPARKGHRRSSSDSFAYVDMAGIFDTDYGPASHDENTHRTMDFPKLWGSLSTDHFNDVRQDSLHVDLNTSGRPTNRTWEWPLTSASNCRNRPTLRDNTIPCGGGSSSALPEADPIPSSIAVKQDHDESHADNKSLLEKKDIAHAKMASESDTKRAKQQFAQRSRVRKLQYIAELEKNVQALQAEGSDVSAELDFLNQQSLILGMENKALKQRLQSLAQEKLIKYLEHEVLDREIVRLRALYQQQQTQQQPLQRQSASGHRRASSKDLDSQFANLNMRSKDAGSGADTVYM